MDNDVKHLFMCLLVIYHFGEMSFLLFNSTVVKEYILFILNPFKLMEMFYDLSYSLC